jgi:hypothetical protein
MYLLLEGESRESNETIGYELREPKRKLPPSNGTICAHLVMCEKPKDDHSG